MEVDVYSKFEKRNLTLGLSHEEFRCKCNYDDCTFTLVNYRLLTAYKNLRKHWGAPLIINSGFRCQAHNLNVGGVRDSWHKKGSAIDIRPTSGRIEDLYFLADKFFDLVIHYQKEGFIHCQMEE